MSKVEYGSFAVTSTGGDTPVLDDFTLNVQKVILFIPSSASETSVGFHDSSSDFTGSSAYNEENYAHSLTHWRNIGGTKTKVFECMVTNMDVGEFSINTTTLSSTTIVHFVAFGS